MHRMTSDNPSPAAPRAAAAAAAIALAALLGFFPAPALAADVAYGEGDVGERDLTVSATVADPPPAVIRVEVPSSTSALGIRVRTSALDGRFLGFAAAKSAIRNLPESTVPISASVSEVADGANGRARALGYLNVTVSADRAVALSEGSGKSDLLVERLEPGSSAGIAVDVSDRTGGAPIPTGEYGIAATVKVRAV